MNLEKNAQPLPPFFYGVLQGIAQEFRGWQGCCRFMRVPSLVLKPGGSSSESVVQHFLVAGETKRHI